jgi:hypothetical protein
MMAMMVRSFVVVVLAMVMRPHTFCRHRIEDAGVACNCTEQQSDNPHFGDAKLQ